ncbi:hypothetical protein JOL79_22200 [Microbispora sp. RL4-1S]|uniref:Uncharacterized protein n=1 Tax=Microbispora oryzae TaxID=2806554 RepID=A0A941AJM8_9ACTN|nr:hypothetical protein [Microbispora oryzae]MBP2706525.1 hypothetical protein [Microbispora oryzae]
MLKRLIIMLFLTGLAVLVVQSIPDIRRYLRIRRMFLAPAPCRGARRGGGHA